MNILGFEKFSLVDYDDKITSTIFLSGCNYRCPFCHNSSLVLQKSNDNKYIKEDEILNFLKSKKGFIDALTITGGEPTLQKDLVSFIKKVKQENFLVKLDTNGTNFEMLKELIELNLVDYVAMDVKNSFLNYASTSGVDNFHLENIKKSISLLKENKVEYEFRTTLVHEFHNDTAIKDIGKILQGAKRYRLQKFINSDSCILNNLHEVSIETAKKWKKYLLSFIDDVDLRSY